MTKAEAGRLGGISTLQKNGAEYMAGLARKGAEALHKKYRLVPIGQNDFALVERETGKVSPKTLNGRRLA
jgi:hypothetical protein